MLRHPCRIDSKAEEIRVCVPKSEKKLLTGLKIGRDSLTFLEIGRKGLRDGMGTYERKISERTENRKNSLILQSQKMKLNGWFFMLLEDRYGERPARMDAKDFLSSFFLSSFFLSSVGFLK